jgi:hypothetical protein
LTRIHFSPSRRASAVLLGALLLSSAACRGKHTRTAVDNEEPEPAAGGPRVASALKMNDPAASPQLIKGFYGIESGAWRWTAQRFAVILRPPLASAERGATLSFSFSIPDIVIQKLHTITLGASVGTTKLKPETYTKAGSYTYTADVSPDLLVKDTITIDFELDKSLTPGAVDQRDLGVIASAVGLESK